MSFLMLDIALQEAKEFLGNSKLLTPEQKKFILEEYRLLLAKEKTAPISTCWENLAKVSINS